MGRFARLLTMIAVGAGAAAALSGCAATTYGTGVDPATQTIRDIANVARIVPTRGEQEDIRYQPRAGIVAPPTTDLPPPGAQTSQTAANWPTDPEEARRRIQAEADAARASGSPVAYDPAIPVADQRANDEDECSLTSSECMYRRVAAAKGTIKPTKDTRSGSVDETGAPVRRYLVEPPVEYRQPSPDAPVEVSQTTKNQREGGGWLQNLWPF